MTDLVIDLSHWNEVASFDAVRASGVLGVIHKCTESDDYLDPTYAARREQAEAAGLLFGAYHFLRPGSMRAQAEWFVQSAGAEAGLLFAADHEDEGVSLPDLKEFLRLVADLTGRNPVLYSGSVLKEQLGDGHDPELARYRLWLAQYTNGDPSWPDHTWLMWWLWQYTEDGSVPGIVGDVDRNIYGPGDPVQLREEWANGFVPEDEVVVTITIDAPPNVTVNVVRN